MLFVTTILWQTQINTLDVLSEDFTDIVEGAGANFNIVDEENHDKLVPGIAAIAVLSKVLTAVSWLFMSCLWSVKLSFLIFFRRLGQKAKGHKTWWRWVLTSIILSCIVSTAFGILVSICIVKSTSTCKLAGLSSLLTSRG